MPQEQILHHAKVHYILYAPGILLMALAYLSMSYIPEIAWSVGVSLSTWQKVNSVVKFLSISAFMGGIALLLRAWLQIYSTEMVVTNMRVLVKIGVSTATTAEIDRARISSVVVTKPLIGRLLDYGWITILGYSGNISGLPAMSKPHEIQKHIYHGILNHRGIM